MEAAFKDLKADKNISRGLWNRIFTDVVI